MLTTTEQNELECTIAELKDALEFEGRVVEKLSSIYGAYCDNGCLSHDHDCRWCRIKCARLAVESEMDRYHRCVAMEEHKFYEIDKYKLDLTVMFGKGNEPTTEEFEEKYLKVQNPCRYEIEK